MTYVKVGSMNGFRSMVSRLPGVWGMPENVYFSQTRTAYAAAYLPKYPEKSEEDSSIYYDHMTGLWMYAGPHAEAHRQFGPIGEVTA